MVSHFQEFCNFLFPHRLHFPHRFRFPHRAIFVYLSLSRSVVRRFPDKSLQLTTMLKLDFQ